MYYLSGWLLVLIIFVTNKTNYYLLSFPRRVSSVVQEAIVDNRQSTSDFRFRKKGTRRDEKRIGGKLLLRLDSSLRSSRFSVVPTEMVRLVHSRSNTASSSVCRSVNSNAWNPFASHEKWEANGFQFLFKNILLVFCSNRDYLHYHINILSSILDYILQFLHILLIAFPPSCA